MCLFLVSFLQEVTNMSCACLILYNIACVRFPSKKMSLFHLTPPFESWPNTRHWQTRSLKGLLRIPLALVHVDSLSHPSLPDIPRTELMTLLNWMWLISLVSQLHDVVHVHWCMFHHTCTVHVPYKVIRKVLLVLHMCRWYLVLYKLSVCCFCPWIYNGSLESIKPFLVIIIVCFTNSLYIL